MKIFCFGKKTADIRVRVVDFLVLHVCSGVIQAGDFFVLVTRGDDGQAVEVIHALEDTDCHLGHCRTLLADRQAILERQWFAIALLGREVSGADAGSNLENPDGIRAIIIEVRGDVCIKSHQDRSDGNQRGDPDDDAQHRQKRPHFVFAQRVQRHLRIFAQGYSHKPSFFWRAPSRARTR